MRQIDVLVEEPSAEEALRHILPEILQGRARFGIRQMKSKGNLLRKLPERLAAYADRIRKGEDIRIVVLVDRDADDCRRLKTELERMAERAGLRTKSSPGTGGVFQVVNRVVVEELEAWFLGDAEALRKAFPGLPRIALRGPFASPDNVMNGTWEALHRFLRKHRVYRGSYPKIEAARKIAPHMDAARNRSPSFRAFTSGVEALLT